MARFVNPAPGGTLGRTDQGVDWSNIRGNIGAVASGVISKVYGNLSGFGTTIIERVKGSPPIYYGLETGSGAPVVKAGQRVQAGQALAPGLGSGGIEVGYWNPQTGRAVGAPDFTGANPTPAGQSFRKALFGSGYSTTNVPGYVPKPYRSWVSTAASQTGLPAKVVAAQINTESGFDPNAQSSAGAQGIAQFLPGTFKTYGKGSPYNANDSLVAYTNYMNTLLNQYNGNIRDALAAYNAGPGNLQAGYGYADSILSAAGVQRSATTTAATSANTTPITRPGGESANQPQGQGVLSMFADYENELNTPRSAPSGFTAYGGLSSPFQWWLQSFLGNWQQEQDGTGT